MAARRLRSASAKNLEHWHNGDVPVEERHDSVELFRENFSTTCQSGSIRELDGWNDFSARDSSPSAIGMATVKKWWPTCVTSSREPKNHGMGLHWPYPRRRGVGRALCCVTVPSGIEPLSWLLVFGSGLRTEPLGANPVSDNSCSHGGAGRWDDWPCAQR